VNEKTATTIVVFTGLILVVLAASDKRSWIDPAKFKKLWAVMLTITSLGFASDVAPDLTGWFALAVLTGAVVTQGKTITSLLPAAPTKQASSPSSGGTK